MTNRVEFQSPATAELVAAIRNEAFNFKRQWCNWLGIAAGGGIAALLSFAANLPFPDHALKVLLPAIAAFVVGGLSAGITLLISSQESVQQADHYAFSFNRSQCEQASSRLPEIFASPKHLADEANRERNHLIKLGKRHGEIADRAWRHFRRWRNVRRATMFASCASLIYGATYPLYLIVAGVAFVP